MNDRGALSRFVPPGAPRWALGVVLGVASLLPILVFRAAIAEPYRIPAGSMMPTLLVGDHVLVARYRYGLNIPGIGTVARWGTPRRGDVVVFDHPDRPGVAYVKRVVAIGGDRVAVVNHRVVLDGIEQSTTPRDGGPYEDADCRPLVASTYDEDLDGTRHRLVIASRPSPVADMDEVAVPEGHLFVLGDHRSSSEDSRVWGFVPVDHVRGRVTSVWLSWDACDGGGSVRPGRAFTSVYAP